jgi:outer membrane biosynthesis protein TonB
MNNSNSRPTDPHAPRRRDSLIAAGVTLLMAVLIFCFLFWGEIGFDRRQMAEASIPEIGQEEEELFLDPQLLDLGEEESQLKDDAAAPAQGTPEVVEKPDPKVTSPRLKGENPKPAPPKEKLVSQTKPSPVKTTEPKATDKEVRKVQSKTAGAFSPDNGQPTGRNNSAGSAGNRTGIAGHSDGWKFLGCPSPDVKLRNKTVITVRVTVNSRGAVTSAVASGGNATLRAACEQAARAARWQPLDPSKARTAKGTITFTITPR